ncbi:MAG: hypothetical protein U0Q12_07045 [Vicinamibacterales bacterium]
MTVRPFGYYYVMRCSGASAAAASLLVLWAAGSARAWSFDVHRFITDRAIDLLPSEIRPFYQSSRAFIVEHSIDPDLWRSAGWAEEPPRHFLDLDAYGAPPFRELPREYDRAVARFGRETLDKNGTVPWRAERVFADLVKAFEQHAAGTGFALENVRFFSAVLAHYVADAHVPFHAVIDYDGQRTNQRGIHARFEGELFDRYRKRLHFAWSPASPRRDARDLVFDALATGFDDVPTLLAADRAAIEGRDAYDARYYDTFFAAARPILERRMARASTAIASLLAGAWEQAGRPRLVGRPALARPAPPSREPQ